VEGGVSILQCADDTILLLEDNLDQARNMKVILCHFEKMSGLKINFHKSDIYYLGGPQIEKKILKEYSLVNLVYYQ
jgi:hypothetical protein